MLKANILSHNRYIISAFFQLLYNYNLPVHVQFKPKFQKKNSQLKKLFENRILISTTPIITFQSSKGFKKPPTKFVGGFERYGV